MKVFQWHGDGYVLPQSAILLASSNLYPQAFRLGSTIGILFHLEVMPEMIQNWIKNYSSEMKEAGVTVDNILNDKKADFERLASNCRVVYSNFAKNIES